MSTLEDWLNAVRAELALDDTTESDDTTELDVPTEQSLVLDLARDVAHAVARPAAPLTAYLLGIAIGRGADPRGAAATITALANSWHPADRNESAGRDRGA